MDAETGCHKTVRQLIRATHTPRHPPHTAPAAPDLAHDGGLAALGAQPVKHPCVNHQLPNDAMPPRLHHQLQGPFQQPAPILSRHHRHQRLLEEAEGGGAPPKPGRLLKQLLHPPVVALGG